MKGPQRTLLCMWMVYSLATTSEMADRVFLVFRLGWVFGLSFTILTVCKEAQSQLNYVPNVRTWSSRRQNFDIGMRARTFGEI